MSEVVKSGVFVSGLGVIWRTSRVMNRANISIKECQRLCDPSRWTRIVKFCGMSAAVGWISRSVGFKLMYLSNMTRGPVLYQ